MLGNRLRSGEVGTQLCGVGHWLRPGEVGTCFWGVGHGEPQALIRGGRHLCSRSRPLATPGEVGTRPKGVGHGESVVAIQLVKAVLTTAVDSHGTIIASLVWLWAISLHKKPQISSHKD